MRSGTKAAVSVVTFFLCVYISVRYLLPFSMPFLLGTGLALAAEPLVRLLSGALRLPRGVSTGIGVSSAFLCFTALLLSLVALLLRELRSLSGILPELVQTIRAGIILLESWLVSLSLRMPKSIQPLIQRELADFFSGSTAFLGKGAQYLLGLAGGILTHIPDRALSVGTAIISGFMISAKLPNIRCRLREWLSRKKLKPVTELLKRLRTTVGRWLAAQLKLSCVTFLILTGGCILLRVPYAPVWSFAITLLDALPILGTGTVLLPWSLICFLQGSRARAVGLLGTYIAASVTRSILEPRLVGQQLGLDPLVTLIALYGGYKLWGFGGMILSPLLAVTAIQLFSAQNG